MDLNAANYLVPAAQRKSKEIFFHPLLSTHFSAAGLSTSHVLADWIHNGSLAAEWARLLITYLFAALSNTQNSKHLNMMRAEPAEVIANRGLMNF